MKKIRRQIFYRLPLGQEIIQTSNGDYFVLDGWNEEDEFGNFEKMIFLMVLN